MSHEKTYRQWQWRQRAMQAIKIKRRQQQALLRYIRVQRAISERSITTLLTELHGTVWGWVNQGRVVPSPSEQALINEVRTRLDSLRRYAA